VCRESDDNSGGGRGSEWLGPVTALIQR